MADEKKQVDVGAVVDKLKKAGFDDYKVNTYLKAKGLVAPEVVERFPTQNDTTPSGISEFSKSVYNGLVPNLAKSLVILPNIAWNGGLDKALEQVPGIYPWAKLGEMGREKINQTTDGVVTKATEDIANQGIDWINNNITALIPAEHNQGIFKLDENHNIHLTNTRSMVNGLGQGIGSMLSFLIPGTAMSKWARLPEITSVIASGTLMSAPMVYESGKNAGLSNEDNIRMTLLLSPILGSIEAVGGVETKAIKGLLGKEVKDETRQLTKEALTKTLQDAVKKGGIKSAEDFASVAKESLFSIKGIARRLVNPHVLKDAAGEAGEEYLQNIVQKAGEQLYDTMYAGDKKQGEGRYGTQLWVDASNPLGGGPSIGGYKYNKKEFIDDLSSAIYGGILGHGMGFIGTPVVNQSLFGYIDTATRKSGSAGTQTAVTAINQVLEGAVKNGQVKEADVPKIQQTVQEMAQVAQLFKAVPENNVSPAARYGAYNLQYNMRPAFVNVVANFENQKQQLATLISEQPDNIIGITQQQKIVASQYDNYKRAIASIEAINENLTQLSKDGRARDIMPTLSAINASKFDISKDAELEPLMKVYGSSNNQNAAEVGNQTAKGAGEEVSGDNGTNNEGTTTAGRAHTISDLIGVPLVYNNTTGTIVKESDGAFVFQPEDGGPAQLASTDAEAPAADFPFEYDTDLVNNKINSNAEEVRSNQGPMSEEGRGPEELQNQSSEDLQRNPEAGAEAGNEEQQIAPILQEVRDVQAKNLGVDAEEMVLLPSEELAMRKKETADAAGEQDEYVAEIDNAEKAKENVNEHIRNETDAVLGSNENNEEASNLYRIGILVGGAEQHGNEENGGTGAQEPAGDNSGGNQQNIEQGKQNTQPEESGAVNKPADAGTETGTRKTVIPAPSNLQPRWEEARKEGQYTEDTHTYVRKPIATNIVKGNTGVSNFSDQAKRVPFTYTLVVLDEVQPTQKGVRVNPYNFIQESQPKPLSEARDLDNQNRAKKGNFENSYIGVSGADPFSGMVNVNDRLEVFQGTGRWNILNYNEDQQGRVDYLKSEAPTTGISAEQIDEFAKQNPNKKIEIVKLYDVNDNEAITLGQYAVTDKESTPQGTRENQLAGKVKPETVAKIRNILVEAARAGMSGSELFRSKADAILKALTTDGVLQATEYSAYFDAQRNLKSNAVDDIQEIMVRVAYPKNGQLVSNLPDRVKSGIMKSVPMVIGVAQEKTIANAVDNAIGAYREYVAETKGTTPVEDWMNAVDNTRGEPKGLFMTDLEKELVKLFAGGKENQIAGMFNTYFENTNGKNDILGQIEPQSREEAVKNTFGVDYQAQVVKSGNQIARSNTELDKVRQEREDIKKRLQELGKKKSGMLMLGTNLDPETLYLTVKLGVNYAQEGIIRFKDWAKKFYRDGLAGELKDYLKEAYEAMRSSNPGIEIVNNMSTKEEVDSTNIEQLEKEIDNENKQNQAIEDAASRRQAELERLGVQSVPVFNRTDVAEGLNARPALRYAYATLYPSVRSTVEQGQYPFIDENQRYAVNAMLQAFKGGKPGFMLGDAPGTGKTAQILVTAHEIALASKKPVLIVVPNEKIIDTRFKADIQKINASNPLQPIKLSSFEFTTYAKLSQKTGTPYAAVLFDEADALSGIDSKRNAAFKQMQADFMVFATATPFETPMQSLYAMSKLMGMNEDDTANYFNFYLTTKQNRAGQDYTAMLIPQDMSESQFYEQYYDKLNTMVQQFVQSGLMVRRAYPFFGSSQDVDVTNAAPAQYSMWRSNVYENYTNWIKNVFRDIKQKKISEVDGLKKIEYIGGQRLQNTEYITESEKAPFIAQDIVRQLKEGRSVVVATEYKGKVGADGKEFMEVEGVRPPGFENKDKPNVVKIPTAIQIIKDYLNKKGIAYGEITGNVSEARSKKAINEFQANNVHVILMTKDSGATGIDLDDQTGDRPRSLYVVSQGFSAKQLQQLLGRVSRRNTKTPAIAYFTRIPASLAEQRYNNITELKASILSAAQDERSDAIGDPVMQKLLSEKAILGRTQKGEAAPISKTTADYIQTVLSKSFPGVTTNILTKTEYESRFGTTTNAHIGTDGVVYYNAAKINSSTQVHEFGHVWTSWAKRYAPSLYQQGIELAKSDPMIMAKVQEQNPGLFGEALAEEALATTIGEKGAIAVEDMTEDEQSNPTIMRLQEWFGNLWNRIKNFIHKTIGISLNDNWQADTIGDFATQVSQQLLKGELISPLTSTEISDIEADLNVPRAQVSYVDAYDKDYLRYTGAGVDQIYTPNYANTQQRLKNGLLDGLNATMQRLIATNPDYTVGEFHNTNQGMLFAKNYFGALLDSVEKKLKDRGVITGEEKGEGLSRQMNKSEDIEIVAAKSALVKGDYDEELKGIANLLLTNSFTNDNMTPAMRSLWNNLVRFTMREQYIAANGDDLFMNENEKVNVDAASVPFKATVEQWNGRLNRFKQNKYLAPVIEQMEKYIRNVANMRLWAQMQTGEKSGILWELVKGMHRGVGKKDYIRTAAYTTLSPLFGAEWLKNGSQTLNYGAKLSELETEEFAGTPITTEEQFNIFMMLQQNRVRGALFGSEQNPTTAQFYVQEFKGEREGKVINLTYQDYERLLAKFDPHWDEVKTSWGTASDYVFNEVQDAFIKENGVRLNKSVKTDPNERWNIYYPLVHGKGSEAIKDFLKYNNFVNDIKSQKVRQPSSDTVYYGSGGIRIMEGYVDDNAQYAGFAIPVRNMNVFFKNNAKFYEENKMKQYVDWWNETQQAMFNPQDSMLGSWEQKILQGFVVSRLGLNPFVFLKQFTSIPLASTVLPSKYLVGASKELFGSLSQEMRNYDIFTDWIGKDKTAIAIQEEMKTHSPYALSRLVHGVNEMEKYVRAHENSVTALFHKLTGKTLKMDDFMKLIRSADAATGAMLWTASKNYVAQEMGLQEGTDQYWRAVDEKYTDAILESQSSIDDVNRPLFPKRNKLLNKALSLFAGQTFSNFNAFVSRTIDYLAHPNPLTKRKLAHSFMNVFVLNSLIVAAVDTLRYSLLGGGNGPDKDKDIFGTAFLRSSYQNIPIIAPVLDAVASKYQNPVFGSDFGYPIFEIINNGASTVASAMRGKEDKALKEMMYFASGLYGVPVTPIKSAQQILK